MATFNGRKTGKAFSRLAVAAIAAALVGVSAGAASADGVYPGHTPAAPKQAPKQAPKARNFAAAAPAATPGNAANPIFALLAVDNSNSGWVYGPNGTGGLGARTIAGYFPYLANDTFVDNNADGDIDGEWQWDGNGNLRYFKDTDTGSGTAIGGGWNTYDKVLSPGNLAGGQAYDLIARDKAGVLWLYLGYGNGTMTSRIKVGAGWGAYTQLAGKGDLNGDGKADIVARDTSGVLWLYKGTGNYNAPFAARTRIGGGWNAYNTLVSTGDVDLDGRTDLIARDTNGGLWLYKGTGNAAAPYQARVQIGYGYNIYRLMTS
ncbi:FG-GAP repeat domain-containing protein [Streptomyces xanthochromogenes]|uniref:FG-GAP repeat domain-containing protein n=1 Tax=Streptomyces xanthochromogenes TaxID=67384 RepID=UPI003424E4CA